LLFLADACAVSAQADTSFSGTWNSNDKLIVNRTFQGIPAGIKMPADKAMTFTRAARSSP
jgi:hypothetical protein